MNELNTLLTSYNIALSYIENEKKIKIESSIKKDIEVLIENIDKNKSIVSALTTSLIKKILDPTQDIRLHRDDFEGGYSARSLDTKVTSQFFKEYFPKYSNKETAFLTLSLRAKIKWDLEDGKNLNIRNKTLKDSFLNIFYKVEEKNVNPKKYLNYLMFKLIELSKDEIKLLENNNINISKNNSLNIHSIISILEKHFNSKKSSRLPVIAIYSIYEILVKSFKRFENKKLNKLEVHTSSDKKTYGDIEIFEKNKPSEIIEIKHNIPIDKYSILDIYNKIKNTNINRYYILTTYKNSFRNENDESEVIELISKIKNEHNFDIIANGILTSIKYYLRMFDNYQEFINIYTTNLQVDFKNSTEINKEHIENWNEILKELK